MSKKRTRRDDPTQGSEEHNLKNQRVSETTAIGILPPSSTTNDAPPPTILPRSNAVTPHSSLSSHSSARRTAGTISRQRKYYENLTRLNFHLYQWAKDKQADLRNRSPSDPPLASSEHFAPNFHVIDQYLHAIEEFKRRYNRTYGDVFVFGTGESGALGCGEMVMEARVPRRVKDSRGLDLNQVACGGLHNLSVDGQGKVTSWGCNDEGSLGAEPREDGFLPCAVTGFHPSEFGPNGRDGGNDIVDEATGEVIPFQQRKDASITMVAAGSTQSLALSDTGDVYFWGTYRDNEGRKFRNMPPKDDNRKPTGRKDMTQLEEDDKESYYHPPRGNQDWPLHLVDIPLRAKDISCGESFNAALLEDDTLVTWGVDQTDESGRGLGALTKQNTDKVLDAMLKPSPPIWAGPQIKRSVTMVSCGGFHMLVVARDEGADGNLNVYSCGLNNFGQCGHGDEKLRKALTKIEYFANKEIATVEGGYQYSFFLSMDNRELHACGRGDYGNLGCTFEKPATKYCELLPRRVPLIYEPKGPVENPQLYSIKEEDINEDEQPEIAQISCGTSHVLALTKDGEVYSWGFGEQGQCGQGDSDADVLRPTKLKIKVKGNATTKVRYVSAGGQHSAIIATTDSPVQS